MKDHQINNQYINDNLMQEYFNLNELIIQN
jgi:hypothetical protein